MTEITDKPQISQTSQIEKRSPQRLEDDKRLRIHEAWLESLDSRVESGLLSPKDRRRRIALASLRKEKWTQRERDRNLIDPMSGLYRQEHLRPRLEELIGRAEPFGILFTDLDHFSEINEKYGHPAGDEIIAQAGFRIREGLREQTEGREEDPAFTGDPYRNGGDEAAILLPGVSNKEDLRKVADRVRSAIMDAPFTVPIINEHVAISVSIGGLVWDGSQTKDEFLKAVDNYLYLAKETRGSVAL
jgi:diguanylate cyclase (GGDEF)-like protein